jgi:hypothetical protein
MSTHNYTISTNAATGWTPVAEVDRETLSQVAKRWADPPAAMVSTLNRGKGVTLDYLGHAETTLALIDIDPAWSWEPMWWDRESGGPLIKKQGNRLVMWGWLTVCGKRLPCVGTCEDRKMEPEKELIGDLLRNGAMRFGIATRLWSKAEGLDHHAPDDATEYVPDEYDLFIGQLKHYAGTPVANAMKAVAADQNKHLSANALRDDPAWYSLARAAFLAAEAEHATHVEEPDEAPVDGPEENQVQATPLTETQRRRLMALSNALGLDRDARLTYAEAILHRPITSFNDLSKIEAEAVTVQMAADQNEMAAAEALTDEADARREAHDADEPF